MPWPPRTTRLRGGWQARGLRLLCIGAAALSALLVATVLPAAAAALPAMEGRGQRWFVPSTGDWEGRVDGFPASFELVYRPLFATVYHRPPYGFEDLVVLAPDRCPLLAASHTEQTVSEGPFLSPLSPGGGFGLASTRGIRGGLVGARAATLSYPLRLQRPAGGGACPSSLRWKLHPARRRRVEDGAWRLTFPTGRSVRFEVSAGGRLATGIPLPNRLGTPSCPAPHRRVSLFIRPDRTAMQIDADRKLTIKLAFSSPSRARGEVSVAATGAACPERSMSLSAKLIR